MVCNLRLESSIVHARLRAVTVYCNFCSAADAAFLPLGFIRATIWLEGYPVWVTQHTTHSFMSIVVQLRRYFALIVDWSRVLSTNPNA
jgi:hypothetical protein